MRRIFVRKKEHWKLIMVNINDHQLIIINDHHLYLLDIICV